MITPLGFFFIFLCLFWFIFLTCRSFINILLSWILSQLVKKTFPHENLQITVEDFGYFSANGISININENRVVRIEQVVLQFVWDECRLKLQSTAKDITLKSHHAGKSKKHKNFTKSSEVVIKAFVTIGINLYAFHPPAELLCIAPETEDIYGSDIAISQLTSLWLFAQNAKVSIQGKINGSDVVSYELEISQGDALILYNSNMARLVFLFKDASATCSSNISTTPDLNTKIAKSEGLVLVYKFEDGILTSSHSRLKHTEINLSPATISCLEALVVSYLNEHFEKNLREENVSERNEVSCSNGELPSEDAEKKCEVAMEAESVAMNVYCIDSSRQFELKLAFFSLGSPKKNKIRWRVNIPFELTFIDGHAGSEKESVLSSKIKSEGLVNPCVLNVEGEELSKKTTKWAVSFHEGIRVEIKPKFVNALEIFIKTYNSRSRSFKHGLNSSTEVFESDNLVPQGNDVIDQDSIDQVDKTTQPNAMCEVSASICDITIDVKDTSDQKLLQIVMMHPTFSLSQDEEIRSVSFKIKTLKGFNCLENVPFFHPTVGPGSEGEEVASLELSIKEKLSNDCNKVSLEKFSFGSCNTTVVAEETLIFAILKDFGLHKKVAQIFFESREEKSEDKSNPPTKRFYFEHIELRAVEVILTLLPAIDLPLDLKVIKNNLGIPHQLPPRFENACLYFDAFTRDNIQYGSYKYISYDIKKHYLKELGSQSARVIGSMHLFGNISRLKQDIMSGFTTLRETGEFITFFHQVTTGVASSYSKFTGSWSDLFGLNSGRSVEEPKANRERRHSDPSDLDVAVLRQLSGESAKLFQVNSTPKGKSRDDSEVFDEDGASESVWLNASLLPDVANEADCLNWDTESSDGEGNLGIPLDLIPRNVKRQLKGQEFLRRLKENLGDNEHGEVFACCFKVRKNVAETKLNALLSNRKVYFLNGRPSHESLVLCVKYETLYKSQYIFQDKTHYLQLINKMKGIRTLSIPSRNPSESPLVRCDNMVIARKVSRKINELKRTYDHEYMHSQHQ